MILKIIALIVFIGLCIKYVTFNDDDADYNHGESDLS